VVPSLDIVDRNIDIQVEIVIFFDIYIQDVFITFEIMSNVNSVINPVIIECSSCIVVSDDNEVLKLKFIVEFLKEFRLLEVVRTTIEIFDLFFIHFV